MTRTTLISILGRLDSAAGAAALTGLLGFPEPPARVRPPAGAPGVVRGVRITARQTLCAWVVRTRRACGGERLRAIERALRRSDPLRHHLVIVIEPRAGRVTFLCDALHAGVCSLTVDRAQLRGSDLEAFEELLPHPDENDTAAALRIGRALDRGRVTQRFFRDVSACRDMVAAHWTGVPRTAVQERAALALLLVSRLIFLYFLQRRGLLAGDAQYLPRLFGEWSRSRSRRSFYTARIRTLFFGVLNRRPERRSLRARRLGDLPYLNGGLFERHATELRRPRLDLADAILQRVFTELLEKYRFTAGGGPDDDGIEPEMLGRIFEGLMPGERRARTGTFYTPAPLVDRLVEDVLAAHFADCADTPALRERAAAVRVLDPACGSGAFLVGALGPLARLRSSLDGVTAEAARRDVVARSLYGVDLLDDAALICSLRLWLSLVPAGQRAAHVPPLPNLDRRIRQGDALIDPLDAVGTAAPVSLQPLLRELVPAGARYLDAGPETRPALRRSLADLERRIARQWLDTMSTALTRRARELAARSQDRDLFGGMLPHARTAQRGQPAVQRRIAELDAFRSDLASAASLPFFSFRVHFAEAGAFDMVLSNPPWVRSHNWPPTVRETLRERYRVCAEAGWPHAACLAGGTRAAGAQVDLSLLFLERSIELLAAGGTLGMVLPAKLIRSLYAGGARALLAASMRLVSIEDQSLDHRAAFEADAFTAVIIARKRDAADVAAGVSPGDVGASSGVGDASSGDAGGAVDVASATDPAGTDMIRVRMSRSGAHALSFECRSTDLAARPGDPHAPWLLAPPAVAAVLRAMQRAAPPLGEQGVQVRRGAMTGHNGALLVRDVTPRLGDLASIRAEGCDRAATGALRRRFSGLVEASVLRRALRGSDVHAWHVEPSRHVLWTPANDDPQAQQPPRLLRYLRRHSAELKQAEPALGTLHRLTPLTLGHKVVWSDLAADLRAAAVQPAMRTAAGLVLPIVPLNTVYFAATASYEESLVLAAYLNSLPVRTFARAVAERAKDAHFRFFAWVVALLPLPRGWRSDARSADLLRIASRAHADGALTPGDRLQLDRVVADAYGLDAPQLDALARFDAWLSGSSCEGT